MCACDPQSIAKRKAAAEGAPFPPLFLTPAMQRLSNIDLSTSTIGGPATELIGFGPVSECGYGIGYLVETDCLKFVITSFKKCVSCYGRALVRDAPLTELCVMVNFVVFHHRKADGTPTGSSSQAFGRVLNDCLRDLKAIVAV